MTSFPADASRPSPMNSHAPSEHQGNTAQVPRRVGVVGLGHMGMAFATNLVADGHEVLVWDRNAELVTTGRPAGALGTARLADLVRCEVIISSVTDDDALRSVVLGPEGLANVLAAGAIHISMSTISPGLSRYLAEVHEREGQNYVAAPVLGNPDAVRSRTLFVLASGRTAAVERVRPLLERLGQRLFLLGEDVAAANLVKLAGNVLTATTLESMAEVLALLRKGGIDPRTGFDVFTNSLFASPVHRIYGGKILNQNYAPGMMVPLAEKDLRLALAEAEHHAVPMPAATLVHTRLMEMMSLGWGDLDWSALGLLAARAAGLNDAVPADRGSE